MKKLNQAVLYFGSYDPNYSRNRIIKKGLLANGISVVDNQAEGLVFIRYFKLFRSFLKTQKQTCAIIVGFPGHLDMPLAFILGKVFDKKVFFDIFASTYETYVIDRKVVDKNSLRAKFFYIIDWLGIRLADYVIIDTITHGKFYEKVYGLNPKKTVLVYVGSDPDYFYLRKIAETTDVLFYGSYQPLQGTDVIIKAAAKLPNVRFKMIGEGQERSSTERLAKSLNLKNVEFIDWLPLEKLGVEIAKAKVCLGIFGNSQKADVVVPNKVFDYLAAGKVLVTGDTTAAREILKNKSTASLVNTGESTDLARQINILIKDIKYARGIGDKGYKFFVKELKPIVVTKNLISKIYED